MDIDAALRKMTPEEKIAVCDGQNFWMTREAAGLPAVLMILAKSVSYAALWSKTGTISLFASV